MSAAPGRKDLHTSVEARARTRRRYRKEARLKLYGILAISLAGLALVSLLTSILSRAAGTLKETHIALDIKLDRKKIDPQKTNDPKIIGKASYSRLIKKSLRKQFPNVKKRSDKRQLYKIVSDVAEFELRKLVMNNPSMIGKTHRINLLASDDTDLYIKGQTGKITNLEAYGDAIPDGTKGNIEVTIRSNALIHAMNAVKLALEKRARVLERQANNQKRAIAATKMLLSRETSPDERAKVQARLDRYERKYQDFTRKIESLRNRVKERGGDEKLGNKLPSLFIKLNGGVIKVNRIKDNHVFGQAIIPLKSADEAHNKEWQLQLISTPEDDRKISDKQIIWLEHLQEKGQINQTLNWHFLTNADASEPEEAGIWGALLGTFWTMLVTFLLAFPIGVMAAIYLEEFAPKNMLTQFIEVNINNLAAVPSIVFGLLGLAVFFGYFGIPYSSPLLGGIVLALMTLPTVIIASRAAIKAVPPSIREAALGVGASRMQTVFHHVLPLAMPGILTGSIIGMAQALGETAPLLMIGMVAFIAEPPTGILDSASALPVQVYLWADRAEVAFDMRTAGAIVILLLFLVVMNLLAVLLRRRFERRW